MFSCEVQLGISSFMSWWIKECCKVSHLFHLCSQALSWNRETLWSWKMPFLMTHNFRLFIALDFYLFLGSLVSSFVTENTVFSFPGWNLFSFVSHLVLNRSRTDRQSSPRRMCCRKAAGMYNLREVWGFLELCRSPPAGGVHGHLV